MERRQHSQSHSQRQQRRNHFSSSSSSNQSRSNNRFSFPKSSSSSSSANDVRDRRRETQEEKQEEAIVGTCPFMCPEAERLQRQRLRDLAVFERLHGDPRNSSPALAVKKVKFHVISHHKLRSSCSSSSISPLHYLNLEQLTKALTSLYNLYEANRSSKPIHEKEAEFRSFYVLLHLDSNGQPVGESLSLWFRHVPSPIIKSKEMWFARQALRYFQMGNYRRFLSTVAAEASYLQYCIIEPYIDEVRSLALCCIHNCCYKLHPYPLGHLSKVLMMEESDVELFCNAYGLQTCIDEVGNKLLPTKQTTFCRPKGGLQNYSFLGFQQLGR
ncbi:hypothetical protein WN944_006726 [Citrus x changshan-huyou]|uniref:SAC3/GANP/THP3 conserved domain-containing protein n=1 Tax=Citrus x changshan-huyou TaxID=2935761 RepID=A0AAP0QXF4_9ROSI